MKPLVVGAARAAALACVLLAATGCHILGAADVPCTSDEHCPKAHVCTVEENCAPATLDAGPDEDGGPGAQ